MVATRGQVAGMARGRGPAVSMVLYDKQGSDIFKVVSVHPATDHPLLSIHPVY